MNIYNQNFYKLIDIWKENIDYADVYIANASIMMIFIKSTSWSIQTDLYKIRDIILSYRPYERTFNKKCKTKDQMRIELERLHTKWYFIFKEIIGCYPSW